jgi:hypothetical protein
MIRKELCRPATAGGGRSREREALPAAHTERACTRDAFWPVVYGTPFFIITYPASLKSIPQERQGAAKIDGASATCPLVLPRHCSCSRCWSCPAPGSLLFVPLLESVDGSRHMQMLRLIFIPVAKPGSSRP